MQQESVDSKKVLRPDGSFMEWFLTRTYSLACWPY